MEIIDSNQIQKIISNSSTFQEALNQWNKYCDSLLNNLDTDTLNTVIDTLAARKTSIKKDFVIRDEIERDPNAQEVLKLMSDFSEGIKALYTHFGGLLTHCTSIPRNDMGDSIKISTNIPNYYHTQIGNWAFASSTPIDGSNLFLLRKSREGMVQVAPDIYILGENHINIIQTKEGNRRAVLDEPNFIYYLKPTNFTPTVTIRKSKDNRPHFCFNGEWTTPQDIDLTDDKIFQGVFAISDVSETIEKYQIFTTIQDQKSPKHSSIRQLYYASEDERIEILFNALKEGKIRYINRRNWYQCPNRISISFT